MVQNKNLKKKKKKQLKYLRIENYSDTSERERDADLDLEDLLKDAAPGLVGVPRDRVRLAEVRPDLLFGGLQRVPECAHHAEQMPRKQASQVKTTERGKKKKVL